MGLWLGAISIPISFYFFHLLGNPDQSTTLHSLPLSTLLLFIFLTFINTLASALVCMVRWAFMSWNFSKEEPDIQVWDLPIMWVMEFWEERLLITEFLKTHLSVVSHLSTIYWFGVSDDTDCNCFDSESDDERWRGKGLITNQFTSKIRVDAQNCWNNDTVG